MKGQSLAAIGTSLKISRATVATLASHCYKKFGVSGRQQLAAVVMGGNPASDQAASQPRPYGVKGRLLNLGLQGFVGDSHDLGT